jgi:hypothetical protein
MRQTLRTTLRRLVEWCAQTQIRCAAYPAKCRLDPHNPPKILLDNSVFRFGVTHSNSWISTGIALWGGKVPIETGYRARTERKFPEPTRWILENEQPYFAPLAHLGKIGRVFYFQSEDLSLERVRHPVSKYTGNRYGRSIWNEVKFDSVDFISRGNRTVSFERMWTRDQQIEDLKRFADAGFQSLVRRLGESHILDCAHLWTAHRKGCFAFMTLDAKFIRHFENCTRGGKLNWLTSKPILPSTVAKSWHLRPVSIANQTPIGADFPYIMGS